MQVPSEPQVFPSNVPKYDLVSKDNIQCIREVVTQIETDYNALKDKSVGLKNRANRQVTSLPLSGDLTEEEIINDCLVRTLDALNLINLTSHESMKNSVDTINSVIDELALVYSAIAFAYDKQFNTETFPLLESFMRIQKAKCKQNKQDDDLRNDSSLDRPSTKKPSRFSRFLRGLVISLAVVVGVFILVLVAYLVLPATVSVFLAGAAAVVLKTLGLSLSTVTTASPLVGAFVAATVTAAIAVVANFANGIRHAVGSRQDPFYVINIDTADKKEKPTKNKCLDEGGSSDILDKLNTVYLVKLPQSVNDYAGYLQEELKKANAENTNRPIYVYVESTNDICMWDNKEERFSSVISVSDKNEEAINDLFIDDGEKRLSDEQLELLKIRQPTTPSSSKEFNDDSNNKNTISNKLDDNSNNNIDNDTTIVNNKIN